MMRVFLRRWGARGLFHQSIKEQEGIKESAAGQGQVQVIAYMRGYKKTCKLLKAINFLPFIDLVL
jgi:hypothetical protein